jgi:hypothetical protein
LACVRGVGGWVSLVRAGLLGLRAVALAVRRWRRPHRSRSAPPAPSRRSPYPPACPSCTSRPSVGGRERLREHWVALNGVAPEAGDPFSGTASVAFIAAPLAPSWTGAGGALFIVGPGPAEPFASARYVAPLNQAVGARRGGAHAHLRPAASFLSPAAPPRPAGMPRRGPSLGPVELEPRRRPRQLQPPTGRREPSPQGPRRYCFARPVRRNSRTSSYNAASSSELRRFGVSHLPESHRLGDKRPYGCVVRVKDRLDRRRGLLPS